MVDLNKSVSIQLEDESSLSEKTQPTGICIDSVIAEHYNCNQQPAITNESDGASDIDLNSENLNISHVGNTVIPVHQSSVNEACQPMDFEKRDTSVPSFMNHGGEDSIITENKSLDNLVQSSSDDMEKDKFVSSMRHAVETVTDTRSCKKEDDEHDARCSEDEGDSDEDATSSSEEEDDSDDTSSVSSTTTSDELVEDKEQIIMEKTEPAIVEMDTQESPATKFEKVLLEAEPEIKDVVDITLPSDAKLEVIGQVSGLIDNSVVVIKGLLKKPALNLDSILFLEDRTVLGQIYETFGPVSSPFYVVCFKDGRPPEELNTGQDIYFAPEIKKFTSYVLTAQLESVRGSDASWQNDKEPPEDAVEYSDDEQEKVAKRNKKIARQMNTDKGDNDASGTEKATPKRERSSRGRGRGNWTNRSTRYVNPSQADDSQVGWMNAVSNPHMRRMGAGAMGFLPHSQGYSSPHMHGRFPYQFPPCFNPTFGGPPYAFHPMMMATPPPPPPPPCNGASYQSECQPPPPPPNVMYYTHPPSLPTAANSPTARPDAPFSS